MLADPVGGTTRSMRRMSPKAKEPVPRNVLGCDVCERERAFLRAQVRPAYEVLPDPILVVDLFAGCGGISLGMAEAANRIGRGFQCAIAVDHDERAVAVYNANFGPHAKELDISRALDGTLGSRPTRFENALVETLHRARPTFLVGGPPCQGHSDLNNHSRRNDPRNELYLAMVRAAELMRPRAVIIENVSAVRHAQEGVVAKAKKHLQSIGYGVAERVFNLSQCGVPQTRKRHVLLALEHGYQPEVTLEDVLKAGCHERDLRWAIGDLHRRRSDDAFDQPSIASQENRKRMAWFFSGGPDRYDLPDELRPACHRDKNHSYRSVYGRLRWTEPAQTITTGFTSMGQGRYVHPAEPRTLTAHEAARLQGFPDFFDFTSGGGRTAWSKLIGNAVPPMFACALASAVFRTWGTATLGRSLRGLRNGATRSADSRLAGA